MKKLILIIACFAPGILVHAEDPQVVVTTASATTEEVAPVEVTEPSDFDSRLAREAESRRMGILILPYRQNYLLPYSNNFNHNTVGLGPDSNKLRDVEAKFQLSIRMPIARGLFWRHGDLQIAYTQVSFWQVYSKDISAPFRETNYEPETFLSFDSGMRLLGSTRQVWMIGISHQSNGRTAPDSRSWNRAFVQAVLARGNGLVSIKPWVRLDERNDDNPQILHYMGHFELRGAYKWKQQVASVMLRNNLKRFSNSQNKGAMEVTYSFPFIRLMRGFVQYFNGYGESLIDYDNYSNRISIGLAFSDWF